MMQLIQREPSNVVVYQTAVRRRFESARPASENRARTHPPMAAKFFNPTRSLDGRRIVLPGLDCDQTSGQLAGMAKGISKQGNR